MTSPGAKGGQAGSAPRTLDWREGVAGLALAPIYDSHFAGFLGVHR